MDIQMAFKRLRHNLTHVHTQLHTNLAKACVSLIHLTVSCKLGWLVSLDAERRKHLIQREKRVASSDLYFRHTERRKQ